MSENLHPIGLGPDHNEYTVVASYREPSSLYCETVLTSDPHAAIDAAWEACKEGNGWDDDREMEDEWTDVLIIVGETKLAPENFWSWKAARKSEEKFSR